MFERFARWVAIKTGHPLVFGLSCIGIVVWALFGPLFHFSDTWQLVVNTVTTVITFLMVFLIQNTQARDTLAIKLQLGEIIRVLQNADDRLISLDRFSEKQLDELLVALQKKAKRT